MIGYQARSHALWLSSPLPLCRNRDLRVRPGVRPQPTRPMTHVGARGVPAQAAVTARC
jgi:hypothetical protein